MTEVDTAEDDQYDVWSESDDELSVCESLWEQ